MLLSECFLLSLLEGLGLKLRRSTAILVKACSVQEAGHRKWLSGQKMGEEWRASLMVWSGWQGDCRAIKRSPEATESGETGAEAMEESSKGSCDKEIVPKTGEGLVPRGLAVQRYQGQ